MKINLYRVAASSNSVNKLAGATFVGSRELTSFNDFRYDDSTFVLSDEPDFNYVTFTSTNGILFCGYITGMIRSNGLYHYYVKNDILEMAYQAGAFNTTMYVTHSKYGSDYLFDDRVAYENKLSTSTKIDIPSTGYKGETMCFVLNVLHPTSPGEAHSTYEYEKLGNTPGIRSYLLTLKELEVFMESIKVKDGDWGEKYGKSMLSCYAMPADYLYLGDTASSQGVTLYGDGGETTINIQEITGNPVTFAKVQAITTSKSYTIRSVDIPSNEQKLDGWKKQGTFIVNMRCASRFTGNISTLGVDTLTSIGVKTTVNLAGSSFMQRLVVNETDRDDFVQYGKFQDVLPLLYDNTYTSWAQYTSQGLSIATGGAMTVLSLMSGNVVGAVMGAASLAASGSGLASSIQQDNIGGYAIAGSVGGTPDAVYGLNSFVQFIWHRPIDIVNFQSKYGKPDYRMRNLTGYHGYVRTANARLYDPRGKLTISDRVLDTTINSEGIFIL